MKTIIKKIPILGGIAGWVYRTLLDRKTKPQPFPGSATYWDHRYTDGGNSGVGSYGKFAEFKAEVLNAFVAVHQVQTIIEFGCGDGNQLVLANYPQYLAFDVSGAAISQCQQLFKSDDKKSFFLMNTYDGQKADLVLSLDVLYHLVEDDVFENYMQTLFSASNRYVIIYSSDSNDNEGYTGTHVRHRKFTEWIKKNLADWRLLKRIPNRYPYRGDYKEGSFADFFIYEKT